MLHYRLRAHCRMAAVALAIRLYEIDHGRRPRTLDELVDAYLPSVPLDPFSKEPRPIGYLPEADSPILYSVNSNGIDENGAFALKPEGTVDWDKKDLPFFLNGDRPRAKTD